MCAKGTYQPYTGTTACYTCASNRYQDELGQLQCKACNPGTYSSTGTSLVNCPVGASCLSCSMQSCSAGTYQPYTSQSACVACSTSSFQNEIGTTACKSCSGGFYRSSPSTQTACPTGAYCTNCALTPCPTGMFQNLTGMTACWTVRSCAAGSYSSGTPTLTTDRACTRCPTQTYTTTVNTLPSCYSATLCNVGTYISTPATFTSNTVCTPCPANTYQDQVGQTACKALVGCSPGYFTSSMPPNGARVCSACPLGYSYQNEMGYTGTTCKTLSAACAPGSYQSRPPTISSDRGCTACTAGSSFQDVSGQTQCKAVTNCAPGTYQTAAPTLISDRTCGACDGTNNYQNEAGMTACKSMTACTASQYITVPGTTISNRQCANCRTSCPNNYYLTGTCGGQSNPSCSPCNPTCLTCSGPNVNNCLSCQSGLTYSASTNLCTTTCQTGSFAYNSTTCVSCNSNCATCAGNSTNCLSCGTSSVLVGGTCLSSCPSNTFLQSINGANRCTPCSNCSAGTFQVQACTAAADISCRAYTPCLVGQYQTVAPTATSDRMCSRCPVPNAFQSQAGQIFCVPTTDCQPGFYITVQPTASTDRVCAPCPSGSSQPQVDQTTCLVCPTGQYQSQPGQAGCLPCAADSYQPAQNSTSCLVVPPGFSRSADGSNRIPCPPGSACPGGAAAPVACDGVTQYQNNPQMTSCLSVALCNAGQYQTLAPSPTNNRLCSNCPPGTFNNQGGNSLTACTPYSICGAGFMQSFNGSTTADVTCVGCQTTFAYQDETGAYSCKPVTTCGPGTSVAVAPTAASNRICQNCISGVNYQDQSNQASCKPVTSCSAGQLQSLAATVSSNAICTACPANTYQNEIGLPSCKPLSTCLPGQYVSSVATVTSDRVCTACAAGSYQPSGGIQTACISATVCTAGSYIVTPPTSTSNSECASCTLNVTYQSVSGATACIPDTVCGAGQLVAGAATLVADRVCQGCPTGTYQDAQVTYATVCKTVRSVCPMGYAENVAPTPTNDRSCVMCDGINFYSDVPGLTLCKTATVCNDTQYISRQPTPFSDRQCADCLTQDDCRTNQILQGSCNGTLATTYCTPCYQTCASCNDTTASSCLSCIDGLHLETTGQCVTSCHAGEYPGSNGACVACNNTCATCGGPGPFNCTTCPTGRFLSGTTCVGTCPTGTFASLMDGRCMPCTTCSSGTYATANCSSVADTGCTPWSVCAAGTYEITAPTSTTNRVCNNCNGVTQYQNQVGQYSCKFTTPCSFPNVQGLPPTPTSDRVCICDTPNCRDIVTQAYNTNMCAPPTSAQLSDGINDCCAGTTSDVFTAILVATTQYNSRHTCPGCLTSNCSCTPGYYQAQSSAGSSCQACDGVTTYSSDLGATACSTITICAAGTMQTVAPTTSSNRVCTPCAAGTTDVNRSGLACTSCPAGDYVPQGSAGPCSQYACPAGSANFGPDASTPCSPCPAGTFQPQAGQTACNATTVCGPGYEEFVMPSPISNRFCRACIPGYTFKAQAGQASACTPVSHCGIGEEEIAAPTLTSDRLCAACPTGTFKPTAGDFACTAVAQCGVGQEEVQLPTAISDRVCRSCAVGVSFRASLTTPMCQPVTPCSGDQYQTVAPTVSSDRQCQQVTNCAVSTQYQVAPPTITSDRMCANCTVCPTGKFQIRECSFLLDAQCNGCDVCTTGKWQSKACTQSDNTECQNCSSCAVGFYQTAQCAPYSDTKCMPTTRCEAYQYIAVPASPVTDAVCRNYTICNYTYQFVFVRETTTSNLVCRDLTVCQPGFQQTVAPGPYSDRVCTQCAVGYSDTSGDGSGCEKCNAGSYVPAGSSGDCSQFACPPGTGDLDSRASTPCVSCNYTYSYQSLSGQTACLPVSQCGPGYQEVAAPTLFTNRVCQSCLAGITFKVAAGSGSQCQFVSQCSSTQWMQAAPTISSDRVCVNNTVCTASQYETLAATWTSDRTCANLTTCGSSEYQSTAPTATSNRVCTPYSNCSSLQYEAVAPTASSDRQCQQLAICILPAYEVTAPTATSNRVCNQSFGTSMYFNGDFDSTASTPDQQALWMNTFNTTMQGLGMSSNAMVGMTIQRGSVLLQAFMRQQAMRAWLYMQMLSGNVTILNTTALLCPTGLYLQLPIDPNGTAVHCLPPTVCTSDYYQSVPMTATADATCKLLTPCVNTAVPPTYTTDRICAVLGEASTSNSAASLSPIVLGIIVVLIALVLALVVGLLLVHRKRERDRKRRQAEYDQARMAETNRAFQDGNMMLSQLNKGGSMNFSNPIFARSGEGYLDVSPAPDWMAGALTREQAEAALSSRVIGAFLIRASSASGCFVLSLKIGEGEYEHHRLQQVGNNFTINGKPLSTPCATIYDVLDHLSQNPEGISCCLAHIPGNCYGVKKDEEPVFYGMHQEEEEDLPMYGAHQPWLCKLSRKEATERLLRENPVRGHFLVRESESKPGHFSISLVISAKDVEHHSLLRGVDGIFLLNDRAMARRCSDLPAVVDHLSTNKETMTCTLNPAFYGAVVSVQQDDMYSDVRNAGKHSSGAAAAASAPVEQALVNPMYFQANMESHYSHLEPVSLPGEVPMPTYFDPSINPLGDGYMSVEGVAPVVRADADVHAYQNVSHESVRRKRETLA